MRALISASIRAGAIPSRSAWSFTPARVQGQPWPSITSGVPRIASTAARSRSLKAAKLNPPRGGAVSSCASYSAARSREVRVEAGGVRGRPVGEVVLFDRGEFDAGGELAQGGELSNRHGGRSRDHALAKACSIAR